MTNASRINAVTIERTGDVNIIKVGYVEIPYVESYDLYIDSSGEISLDIKIRCKDLNILLALETPQAAYEIGKEEN